MKVESVHIDNWKKVIENGDVYLRNELKVINFIQSLVDTIENHKEVLKKQEEFAEADSKTITSLKKENEARKDENYWLREEMQKVKEDNEKLTNEFGNIQTVHKASETQLDALAKMAVGISKLQTEHTQLHDELQNRIHDIQRLKEDKKILESRNDSLIGLLKSIPCSLNADGSYNKKVIKSFIQEGIAAKRKSGIYEVRFNGATSNVWLRWCENNKHFEAYGTAQKYYDKDMSYVDPNMAYDWSPRPF